MIFNMDLQMFYLWFTLQCSLSRYKTGGAIKSSRDHHD